MVVERLVTFEDKRPNYLPHHKSMLTIGDHFIGFSSPCVSHDFSPEYLTRTQDVPKTSDV